MTTKTCRTCHRELPLNAFSKHKSSKDGLQSQCRDCANDFRRKWGAEHRDHLAAYDRKYQAKYRSDNSQRIKDSARAYYEAHRQEKLVYQRKYRAAHMAQEHERNQRRRGNPQRLAYDKQYREANKDKIRETKRRWVQINRVRHTESGKAWRQANIYRARHNGIIQKHRRRARLLALEGSFTAADTVAQYQRQKGRCYYCQRKLNNDCEIEHVVPITRPGSSNAPSNIVIACPSCNRHKGNKLPHEWSEGGRLL